MSDEPLDVEEPKDEARLLGEETDAEGKESSYVKTEDEDDTNENVKVAWMTELFAGCCDWKCLCFWTKLPSSRQE